MNTNSDKAILILSVLSILLFLFARQFDRHVYIPFLRRAGFRPVNNPPGIAPDLLRLSLVVAECGALIYAAIGWLSLSLSLCYR